MVKFLYLNYFRKGRATNSSSTHSIIYKNKGEIMKDLNIFEENYYDRCMRTIAATKSAKIKYVYACIYDWDRMAEVLSNKYPEMKQYFKLAKMEANRSDGDNDWMPYIGEHCRGSIAPYDNFEVAYEHLCNVIDNDDIIIVGGSDEEDFVYDILEGHDKVSTHFYTNDKMSFFKNGNYYCCYSRYGDKIRLCTTKDNMPIPEMPELIDLLITKKCKHACPFCYNNSTKNGDHASVNDIRNIIAKINKPTEFSIGGGNVLEHPDLEGIFQAIKPHLSDRWRENHKHIINVTINSKDVVDIINNDSYKNLFMKYVDGIGISIQTANDIEMWKQMISVFPDKYITIHIIPEMIGVAESLSIINSAYYIYTTEKKGNYPNFLFLGFKESGRGCNVKYNKLTDNELDALFNSRGVKHVDTSFANRYKGYISENFENMTVTYNEGEYSMFIDAVDMKAYISSYILNTPHALKFDDWRKNTIKDAFSLIRQEGGFTVYNEKNYKKYYEKE